MNSKSDSSYGASFFIRIAILLVLLVGIGGAFAYDRMVLLPAGKEAVDRVVEASGQAGANRTAVHEAAGCEPTSSETAGDYLIEDWSFSRILPNLEGYKVTVVYLDDQVAETFRGGIRDSEREEFRK
ncbi:hypothetical protein [Mariniblastus fucicola]|uniref:Uncharacterized protein n=1 Tax=Mariniblastus fucicola TaxID=980251 RepID=A0A5B9P7H6_9BACT|nr:hypothetical protein [Mariniblastus fucicola]QEG20556.1 hypothetical protein MFFC18_04050 [Mariniblastus fucicola]